MPPDREEQKRHWGASARQEDEHEAGGRDGLREGVTHLARIVPLRLG